MTDTARTTTPGDPRRSVTRPILTWTGRVLAWAAVLITLVYAAWVLGVAVDTLLAIAGISQPAKERAIPPLFALHAVSGALSLASGALQLRLLGVTLRTRPWLHRLLGRSYLCASWTTSLAGLAVASGFEVGLSAKAAFTVEASLWFGASTLAYRYARRRDYAGHHQWMIRSYALALFFVTFSIIQPIISATDATKTTVYTTSILASVLINLAAAESWIHWRRSEA
jgi:hypothetical protein